MDIYDSLFTVNSAMNDQIAHEIFELLPADGPVLAIIDKQGNIWASDTEKLALLNVDQEWLGSICSRVDDGSEPVVSQWNGWGIVVGELATDQKKLGYVVIAMEAHSPEATLTKLDLVEIIFSQFNLIARLIENGQRMSQLHMKMCWNN